jgi:carbon monoxide dehydrogenase subunit G
MPNLRSILIPFAFLLLPVAAHAEARDVPDAKDIKVAVHRDGKEFQVDVDFTVAATPRQAWDVLTDYEHMSQFVSTVAASRVVGHERGNLQVAQTVQTKLGPFDMKFDNVRDIELLPLQEIRSTLIQGDMKSSEFTTRVALEGDMTRVTNHGRFTPDRWVPPLIGTAMIEAQTRKQFAEFRAEILRRKESGVAALHP